MADIFLKVINMSISAGWLVLAVLVLRWLLQKAPKWINGILWGIVGIRLAMPFSLESIFSLIPSTQTLSKAPDAPRPYFESGVTVVDSQVNEYLQGHYFEGVTRPQGHFVDVTTILAMVWLIGIAALLIYTIISYLRLKNKIGTAVLLRDNIFRSESVVSAFVLGIIRPKIYLPFDMREKDMHHVIAHENAHIRRKDHLWKPLGFLLLAIHWFNPLMWLGYVLLCRDIELACDEKVIRMLNTEQKADYSQALLSCSVNRRMIAACPLAFGEVGVKDRVQSVLSYKKPAFWIIVVAVIASIVAAVCFLTDPVSTNKNEMLLEVLHNERTFINQDGETVYFKNHKPFDGVVAVPEKYALVDLDRDGNEELIAYITPDFGAYTVFHMYDGNVYGYDFVERALINLKADGTFMQSEGAGINSFVTLHFEKDTYTIVEQAYQDDMAAQYRKNGKASTMEDVQKYADAFHNKRDAGWEKYEIVFHASNTIYNNLKIVPALNYEQGTMVKLTVFNEKTQQNIQVIEPQQYEMFTDEILYVKDVNFDGQDDLMIPYQRTAAAAYFAAYVWDSATKQFVYAAGFENISNAALDTDKKVILSHRSANQTTSYAISVFDVQTKEFKLQRSLYYYPQDENVIYIEEFYENGEAQTVAEYSKPMVNADPYAMDAELYKHYSNHAQWDLDSSKWENYVISPNETDFSNGNPNELLIYRRFLEGKSTAVDTNGVAKSLEDYILSDAVTGEYTYTYLDMTGDGVPELCIDTLPNMYFFTIRNEKLYLWHTETNVWYKLLNNGALLMIHPGGGPEHIYYAYYELDKNANKQSYVEFSWYDGKTVEKGKVFPDTYFWGEQEVSKEEYDQKTKQYLSIGDDEIVWHEGQVNGG